MHSNDLVSALFVIDTPAQVINIQEAIHYYNIDIVDVVVNECCRGDAFEQTISLLKAMKSVRKYIEIPRVTSSADERIRAYSKFLPEFVTNNYCLVFFSNVRQHWQRDIVCSLPGSRIVLMDDGIANVVFSDFIFNKGKVFDFPDDLDLERAKLVAALRSEENICTELNKPIEIFSSYDLKLPDEIKLSKNPLNSLKKIHNISDPSQVFILGSGYVDQGYISLEDYVLLISGICEQFSKQDVTYITHRNESKKLLQALKENEKLKDRLNFMSLGMPIEIWLKEKENPPMHIVGFFSAALHIISHSFEKISTYAVISDMSLWGPAKKNAIWNVTSYSNYESLLSLNNYFKSDSKVKGINVSTGDVNSRCRSYKIS